MAAPDFANNHLAVEPVLIGYLDTAVTALQEVGGAAEFDRALSGDDPDHPPKYPSAYCLYAGPAPGKATGSSRTGSRIEQVWQIAIMAQTSLVSSTAQLAAPGAVLAAVIKAMAAWQPEGVIAVQPVPYGGEPVIYDDGLVHFFLAYQIDFQIK